MERSITVLQEFGAAIMATGAQGRAAGTSALRRAENAPDFLDRARAALGFAVEILSGANEARLGYRGALSDLPMELDELHPPIVLDPGGGSTEVFQALASGLAVSLEVGAVRLTEAFLHHDPPTSGELEALVEHVRGISEQLNASTEAPLVAVGGTATTLAALALKLERYDGSKVHGFRLSLSTIRTLRERLVAVPLVERAKIPCLPPGRADIAVAGALLLEELVEHLGAQCVVVSDRWLRFGLIAEILEA